MTEFGTERECVRIAKAEGWLVRKVSYVGRRNAPDRWFFKGGVLLLVEFKYWDAEPNATQAREHKRLEDAGFPVYVIRTVSEFRELLDREGSK